MVVIFLPSVERERVGRAKNKRPTSGALFGGPRARG
jgi:hypothetical protein